MSRAAPAIGLLGARRLRIRARAPLVLWIPSSVVALLLAPAALLVIPLVLAILSRGRGHPVRATLALGAAILALSGTLIQIESRHARLNLRLF